MGHVFTLPSGVECEVSKLKGKHQKLLTQQDSNLLDNMNQILCDVIVRVGSVTGSGINFDFTEKLLSRDRNFIMFNVRQYSLGFPLEFKTPFKYKSVHTKQNIDEEISVLLSEITMKPYSFQVEEYSEIVRDYFLDVVDYEGGKIRITLPDGAAERRISAKKKKEQSSHLDIQQCNPVFFTEKNIPVSVNLDELDFLSIEDLRKQILRILGKFDTTISAEHPESDYKSQGDKFIRFNLLSDPNFFFPSGAFSQ